MSEKLNALQAMLVANDCVRQVTHSNRPLNPSEQLLLYGVNTPQQTAAIRHNVVANGSIGVQRFNFSLHPGFLATLNKSWTFKQLAGVIRQNSVPNTERMLFAQPEFSDIEKVAATSAKFAEAADFMSEIANTHPTQDTNDDEFDEITDEILMKWRRSE